MDTHPVSGQLGPVQVHASSVGHNIATNQSGSKSSRSTGEFTSHPAASDIQTALAKKASSETRSTTPSDRPKPKKRGRKPKIRVEDPNLEDYEELDDDGLPTDPRRRRVLERNRVAANKCRLRKRDEASALASQEQSMEDQHRYLSSLSVSLTSEIIHLKNQLLQHTDCNCTLIQRYIAHQAKRSVDDMLGVSSTGLTGDSMSPDLARSTPDSFSASMMTSPETDNLHAAWPKPSPLAISAVPGVLESQSHLAASCVEDFRPLAVVGNNAISVAASIMPVPTTQFDACQGAILATHVPQPPPPPMDSMVWDPSWGPPR